MRKWQKVKEGEVSGANLWLHVGTTPPPFQLNAQIAISLLY